MFKNFSHFDDTMLRSIIRSTVEVTDKLRAALFFLPQTFIVLNNLADVSGQ